MKVKLIVISDTHCMDLRDLLKGISGDFLLHCGDGTNIGSYEEIIELTNQLQAVKPQFSRGVIFTPGNHDTFFEKFPLFRQAIGRKIGCHILVDEGIEIAGINFWASPYTPRTNPKSVFQYPKGAAGPRWGAIPYGLDVLITHGPPGDILDLSPKDGKIGCWDLRHEIMKKRPKIHCFGHNHIQGGRKETISNIDFYNCAVKYWGTDTFNGITEIIYEKDESPGGEA